MGVASRALACASWILLFGCTDPAPTPRAAPARSTASSALRPSQPSHPPASAPPTDAPAPAPDPTPLRSDSARFRCGAASCQTQTQTCCEASGDGVCVPTLKDGPHDQIGFFKDQWESCDEALRGGYSLSGIGRCDESIDCPGAEICCEQFLFSGGSVALCEPPKAFGKTPCEFGELCLEGTLCRMPDTECRAGYCQKIVKQLSCAGKRCRQGQSCCGDPPICQDFDCSRSEARIACGGSQDCVPGQRCILQSTGTFCTGLVDLVTPGWLDDRGWSLVCSRDTDCPKICAKGPARCSSSQTGGIKHCTCP